MLIHHYPHNIDAKGRTTVPVKFREDLGDEFIITRAPDKCLYIYPMERWEEIRTALKSLPISKKSARDFSRLFLAWAAPCELDGQGRVLIPAILRQSAALDKEIIIAGAGDHAEIWDKQHWDEYNETLSQNTDSIFEEISAYGI